MGKRRNTLGAMRDVTNASAEERAKFWREFKEAVDKEPSQGWAKERRQGDPNNPIIKEGLWKGFPKNSAPESAKTDGLGRMRGSPDFDSRGYRDLHPTKLGSPWPWWVYALLYGAGAYVVFKHVLKPSLKVPANAVVVPGRVVP